MATLNELEARVNTHEEVCALRYDGINARLKRLELTNAHKGRIGEGLILNTELIMSFFEHTQEDNTKVTVAFGMNGNSWEVQETIDEIMDLSGGK